MNCSQMFETAEQATGKTIALHDEPTVPTATR
jgi:hypothetical protein